MSVVKAATQNETIEAFIKTWKELAIDDMAAFYTPDFEYIGLPAAVLGGQPINSEQWIGFVRPIWPLQTNFEIKLHTITNDGAAGRAVIHAKTYADLPVMNYRNEHIMIVHFSEDGKKIRKLEDMMDSAFVTEMQTKMGEYLKNKAGQA